MKKEDVQPKKPAELPVKKEQPQKENKPHEQKKSSGKKKRPKPKPVPVVKEEAKEPPKIETRVFTKKKPEEEKKTEKQGFFRKIINDLKQ